MIFFWPELLFMIYLFVLSYIYILYVYNSSIVMYLQILFELLAKGGTVKGLIEEKDLVQVSC